MSAKRANRQKLEELKKKLAQLENVKLPACFEEIR
jgi:hypothetical protein